MHRDNTPSVLKIKFFSTNTFFIDNYEIFNSNCQKLLGVKIDNKLSFNEHVPGLCKKASQKLYALARVAYYMSIEDRQVIM